MKDRVRESVFALLGPRIVGRFAVDLFAGTGALGFEALSRGAARALFLERHFPTAHVIRDNARALEMADRAEVFPGDAFVWVKHRMPPAEAPWVVFCSPPYDFFVERRDEMIEMVRTLARHARPETLLVLESDERFDFAALSELTWDLRTYAPAQIGIAVVP